MQLRGAVGVARDDVQQRLLVVRERRVQAARVVVEAVAYVLIARARRVLRSRRLLLLWGLLGVRLLVLLLLRLVLGVVGLWRLLGVVLGQSLVRLVGSCVLLVGVVRLLVLLVGVGLVALEGGLVSLLVWLLVGCCLVWLLVRVRLVLGRLVGAGLVRVRVRMVRLLVGVGGVRVRDGGLLGVRAGAVLVGA
ncbi:hypothetical protein ADK86_15370 [Streptomyces sp. NRRL F-5755]|nr:hypothetical protein ADK86_15370 [Streptomyces sp. NRRL F-5755]